MRELGTYIHVDDGMPEHPKIVGLTDKAFRTLLALWCYCSRQLTDGRVPMPIAAHHPRRAILELEKAGLLESREGDWYCHDYPDWQRTASEVATIMSKRGSAASLAAHTRWHVRRNRFNADCPHCSAPP
jgi:hypothetical protein